MKSIIYKLIILLTFGVLILTACSNAEENPTVSWNLYENEKYGYAFKVPPDCFIGRMPSDCKEVPPEERRAECLCIMNGDNPDQVFLQKFFDNAGRFSLAAFTVSHHDSPYFNPPPDVDISGWIKKNIPDMYVLVPDGPNTEIGGMPAVEILSPPSQGVPSFVDIYFLHEDLLFQVNLLDVDQESNKDLYDQILSTFSIGK
jgi:hypothetical protein